MPQEMDYEFGKRAVSAGRLTQDQLEECVEILVALERVGSKQRLWQTVQRKAYMSEAAIAEIRASLDGAAPVVPVAPRVPAAPQAATAPPAATSEEETADDLHLPLHRARGFVLAHVHKGAQTKVYPLPPRMATLGKGASCDIVLSDAGVLELHARLSFREETHEIEEAVPGGGILVNDQRVRTHKLVPYDLVKLGSALLLFLPDYGDQPAAEPVDPAAAGGAPCARVRIAEGSRKAAEFYLGSSPLVIGRHMLANVHLREAAVAAFHAQIAQTQQGVRLADLLSAAGTKVNGVHADWKLLNDGDNISIGPVTLAFDLVPPPIGGKADRPTGPAVEQKPAAAPESKAEGSKDWNIAAEVEVEPVSDPFLRRGTKVPRADAVAHVPFKAFKPGDLRLLCIKGPLEGQRFVIARRSMIIGRDDGLDLTIPDGSVSRRHAEIVLGPEKAEVKDLGSRNGVFVNGARVASASIRPGDTLRVYKSLFVVEEIPPRPQPRKS
ncbi:MAG: FHA domain-containing protein [Candidatus Brocadiia bacterium]|jgi:pSer/pThr/pTyr-binding forkhead associated (FHA) protein